MLGAMSRSTGVIGYADCDQHDLERRGDHLPLGKILADGAGGGVVTTFTMAAGAT